MSHKSNFYKRITQNQAAFSPNDKKIAEYLLHSYPGGLLETASAIAGKLDLSVATITRFFPKIGFNSIRDAQEEFKNRFDFLKDSPLDRYQKKRTAEENKTIFDKAWDLDMANIQQTAANIDKKDVQQFVDLICSKDRTIYIVGERKMFAMSFYLYVQLNSLHPNIVHIRTDQSLIADTVAKARPEDVLILFDFRRYPKASIRLADIFRTMGCKIVVIGDSPISPSIGYADISFLVETKGVSIFDSYTPGMTLINALVAEVAQKSGDYVIAHHEKLEECYRKLELFTNYQDKT